MGIAANEIHERTVKCWHAVRVRPDLLALMKDELKAALKAQAEKVGPALNLLAHRDQSEDDALSNAEKTLEKSRDMMMQIHDGVRYQYRHHVEQRRRLSPLKLGKDPAEDGVHLATLERELPKAKPAFLWLPDEGLTHDALKKQLAAHREAAQVESSTGTAERDALKLLREERPASRELWDNEGLGLEAWVIASVPKDEQFAFGRERRKHPRAAKPAEDKPKTKGGKESKSAGDQTSGGDSKSGGDAGAKTSGSAPGTPPPSGTAAGSTSTPPPPSGTGAGAGASGESAPEKKSA